jgi:hypothetical protein
MRIASSADDVQKKRYERQINAAAEKKTTPIKSPVQ